MAATYREYVDYLAEHLNSVIDYSDYVAQSLDFQYCPSCGSVNRGNKYCNICGNMMMIKNFQDFMLPQQPTYKSKTTTVKKTVAVPEKTADEIAAESIQIKGQKVKFNFQSATQNEEDPIL